MTILYFDCHAGISGDMTVGALLELGVPLDHLRTELSRLSLPPDSYTISVCNTKRQQMPALMFDVAVHDNTTHRHYGTIDSMIADSGLSESVKGRARAIFRRLAEAEAKVHGVALEKVHFHEVGAIDSIIDIVGTAICLEYLGVDRLYASSLPLGSGFVNTAHGRLPVPAPATAELMQGMVLHGDCGPGERVTPTGAAIIASLSSGTGKRPEMILEKIGCGAGGKEFEDCPNILRAFLGRPAEAADRDGQVAVVDTNIDDSTPEVLGYAMERLLEEGALDVFFTPIQMKKSRPGVMLSFLCHPERVASLGQLVLNETSAIGLRYHRVDRMTLQRQISEQQTEFGTIRFKQVFGNERELLRSAPEYDDCRRIARERGIPLQKVLQAEPSDTHHARFHPPGGCEMEREDAYSLDNELASLFVQGGVTLALAESCTGGMIAERITAVAGSSAYFLEGAVTYSNSAKIRQLGVPAELLEKYGAVSCEVASAMASGIRTAAGTDLGLSVTGIAGPEGGSSDKPVGTVYIGLATPDGCRVEKFLFCGDRGQIRSMTTSAALERLKAYLLKFIEPSAYPPPHSR